MKWRVTFPDGKFTDAPTYLGAAREVEILLETSKLPVGSKIEIERIQ